MKNMTFLGFISLERLQLLWGICIFWHWSPSANFCTVDEFAVAPTKVVPICNGENRSVFGYTPLVESL